MTSKRLEDLAEAFWGAVNADATFPRELEAVISSVKPVTIRALSPLTPCRITDWLRTHRCPFPLATPERFLNGCLVGRDGEAFLFVDAELKADDRRMIVAHEFAHFLAEYDAPRQSLLDRLGPALLEVFDGARAPTPAEEIEASLAGIKLGTHVHYMDRHPDGTYSEPTSKVEQTANDLALELLAPWRTVLDLMRKKGPPPLAAPPWVEVLEQNFGLPASWAIPYGARLLKRAEADRSFSDSFGLKIHEPEPDTSIPNAPLPPAADGDERLLTAEEINRALGQTLQEALDLRGWDQNAGLEQLLTRTHKYVLTSVREESRLRTAIRQRVLNDLPHFTDAPAQAGVYRVTKAQLRSAYRNHLLRGAVTAVNGAGTGHDGLAATLVSIGVSLVRYDGSHHSWHTTFLRHDYGLSGGDPVKEIRDFLDRRARRSPNGPGTGFHRDHLTYLLRRGFMAAAERKALLEKAATPWRLGHGTPAPLELLTGSGSMALIDEVLPILERLLLVEKRWVFIPATLSNRALTTLANALDPGQIAIFQKGKASLDVMVQTGTFDAEHRRRVQEFAHRLGEAMVIGGFRATQYAPGQLFVAHAENALPAGVIALADAMLQPHRGFPLLLDLAGLSCRVSLGIEAFPGIVESAYVRAGAGGFFSPDGVLAASGLA